jgi:hypothetical protein
MSNLRLGLRENRTAYAPGETITGAVDWDGEKPPRSAEVRLGWLTRGKGSEDHAIAETMHFDDPVATDLRTFTFTAPAEPYSFSGRLISLIWVVEAVLQPGDRLARQEIVIAPEGRERVLGSAA